MQTNVGHYGEPMKNSKIFLVGEEDSLITMTETDYVAEDILQEFLACYPDLLPGDQIDPENPRHWLLVSREMGVPGDIAETNRWSLDHLFLDQEGIPTFVECKRAVDTRSRREVVAQMLDYAANGIEYWSIDQIRQTAAVTAQKQDKTLEEELGKLLDDDNAAIASYWELVKANLDAKRVRLLFVMDTIPKELRRLVEFLNEEMTHVEVLAVEIKQFQRETGKGYKALVPRVIGFTETARDVKMGTPVRQKPMTFDEFMEKCDPEIAPFYTRVIKLAGQHGYQVSWGAKSFSVRGQFQGERGSFLYGWPNKRFDFYYGSWRSLLQDELRSIQEKLLALKVFERTGEWSLTTTVTKENMAHLNEICDFIFDEINKILQRY